MKELESFLKNILEQKEGYSLGEPWKYNKTSVGVIIPILRMNAPKRDYTTLPEVKNKVKFRDTGGISKVDIKGIDIPLFIRAGTILEGMGTQSRSPTHSIVVEPDIDVEVDVRCVHASHGIHGGSNFEYSGLAPREVVKSLHRGNQSDVWGSVNSYYMSMGAQARERPITMSNFSLKMDSLPEIKKAQQKLDKNLQDILKEVPVLENQIGAVIVGMKGVIGLESFDHPESWKAQYKEVIESYSDAISESTKLFTFDDKEIVGIVKSFFNKILDAQITAISPERTYTIKFKGYIGEIVKMNSHIIHMFVMETDEDDKANSQESMLSRVRNNYESYERPIGTARVGSPLRFYGDTPQPRSYGLHFDIITTKGMKKGFKEIADTMRSQSNGTASWSTLQSEFKKKKMSSATLSQRLKEGKEIGIFGEKLKDGKKVYTLYNEE